MKIEEILGFTSSTGKDAETVSKRYYVKCGPNEGPDAAKSAFQTFAEGLPVPANMERGDVGLEEDKNVNGLYYGTVTFRSPSPKIKKKIDDDLFESFGEKMSEGRKSGSHERFFRIKSDSAKAALTRLENHIRATTETSGRLHINDILQTARNCTYSKDWKLRVISVWSSSRNFSSAFARQSSIALQKVSKS